MQQHRVTRWQRLCAWAFDRRAADWLYRLGRRGWRHGLYLYLAGQSYHVWTVNSYRGEVADA